MNSPRILIAGITGFLGSRLAHEFLMKRNAAVSGIHRQASNFVRIERICSPINLYNIESQDLRAIFKYGRFDVVVNCLADYGISSTQQELIEANLHLPTQLIELASAHGATVFLNAGTSLPADVNDYAYAKNQFSRHMMNFCADVVAIDARLEHFYGAGESAGRFITFLIQRFLEPAAELDVTAGEQQRDFIYIDDVASAIGLLAQKGTNWRPGYYPISVGTGRANRLRDVVELVRGLTGNTQTHVNYGAVPHRAHEIMFSKADIGQLTNLGWRPQYSLNAGLERTVEAYRRQDRKRRAA